MNALNPNLMTTRERLGEVCAILSRGVCRLRLRDAEETSLCDPNGLHFAAEASGRVCPNDQRTP